MKEKIKITEEDIAVLELVEDPILLQEAIDEGGELTEILKEIQRRQSK